MELHRIMKEVPEIRKKNFSTSTSGEHLQSKRKVYLTFVHRKRTRFRLVQQHKKEPQLLAWGLLLSSVGQNPDRNWRRLQSFIWTNSLQDVPTSAGRRSLLQCVINTEKGEATESMKPVWSLQLITNANASDGKHEMNQDI